MEEAVVMLPSPVIGHLISLVELAKAILMRRPSFSVHILLLRAPYTAGSTSSYISSVSSSSPSIRFHHFLTNFIPPDVPPAHKETLIFRTIIQNLPQVRHSLEEISRSQTIRAFVIDAFCFSALEIASQFQIPTYYYFTSPAGCLNCFGYLSTLHNSDTRSFGELNKTLIEIPGIPPIAARDLVKPLLDRNDEAYERFLNFSLSIPKSAGILVNTFEALEIHAIDAWRNGLCVPNNETPPIYCTGPLLNSQEKINSADNECLKWLDSQPEKSVALLSFGSLGVFSKEQIVEIAMGLEGSGQRFLWVVRIPPSNEEVDEVLPEGFKERTKKRGFIVKDWAPQAEILKHAAIGGFVTHCGWNSVLESVCAGVPMVAWPLYAEQRMNRVLLKGSEIAVPIEEDDLGFVRREEVEEKVREIMEGAVGDICRKSCGEFMVEAGIALQPGGSSIANLDAFCQRISIM